MNLRWVERRIPDSCRVEMILQYFHPGVSNGNPDHWYDVHIERLPHIPRDSDRVGPI